MKDCLMINPQDNVGIALRELQTGETVTVGERTIVIKEPILKGHKFALKTSLKMKTSSNTAFRSGTPLK